MDANWRPMQGSDPASAGGGADPSAPAEGDWRAQLQPEARSRIVNKIMATLRSNLPVSLVARPEALNQLQKIAAQFEEKIYTLATNQSDYLRKIALRMLSMETGTQQSPKIAQVIPDQNNPAQASVDSTAQIGHASAGDWREETYQMIKSLKDQHFAELSLLFDRICVKLQHVDSIRPPQKPSEFDEKTKRVKITLDHLLQLLLISKSSIQPDTRGKVRRFEEQIIDISKKSRAAREKFQPPAGQAHNPNIFLQEQQSSSATGIRHVPVPPTTNCNVPAQRNGVNIQGKTCYNMEAPQERTELMQGTMNTQKKMQVGGHIPQDSGNTSPGRTRLTWMGDTTLSGFF